MSISLDKEKSIVLYGAGEKAHSLYHLLQIVGYTIAYCVISTDFVIDSDFEDIKVYSFIQKREEIIEQGYQVVIAAGANYEEEIAVSLKKNGICQFWKRSDMPWNVEFAGYQENGEKEYLEIIHKKYLSNVEQYAGDERIKNFFGRFEKSKRNCNKVMFLLTHVSPRAYKIIGALHRKGVLVDVLIWANAMGVRRETHEEYSEISDWCVISADFEEVMLYCAATDAKVLHIFSHADTDLELPQTLMHCKSIFPPIVFDEYDVYVEMRNHIAQKTIETELFCFRNADGLCNRYTCMEYLEEKGYPICKKRIYFLDCCQDDTNYESLEKQESEELELVFVGSMYTGKAYENCKATRLLEFGDICRENKAHLHIYPSSYDEARLQEYINMEKVNPYFHMHRSVPAAALALEISKYDYGIMDAQQGFLEYDGQDSVFTKAMWLYCAANKLYDYLDAGLPIISAFPVGQARVLEAEGVLVRKVNEEIDFDELRQRRNEMKKRVVEVREKYRISNQLPALIKFYDSL